MIFKYDVDFLQLFTQTLKQLNYGLLQYLPATKSWRGSVREHKNLLNVFRRSNFHLLNSSVFPRIYQILAGGKQADQLNSLLNACFYNKWTSTEKLKILVTQRIYEEGLANQLIIEKNGMCQFTLCFMPFKSYIIALDPYYTYSAQFNGEFSFDDQIWMDIDSIYFAEFLLKYLKNKRFERVLDIGSGSGIDSMIMSKLAKACTAIDINERALKFTQINAILNGITNITIQKSNFFDEVSGQYDLIMANPWSGDLASGGLEQLPVIADQLEPFLENDGVCALRLSSYVIHGKDMCYRFLKNFAYREKFAVEMIAFRYDTQPHRLKIWEKFGVDYCINYFAFLKKSLNSTMVKKDISYFRKIFDFLLIYSMRIKYKFFEQAKH